MSTRLSLKQLLLNLQRGAARNGSRAPRNCPTVADSCGNAATCSQSVSFTNGIFTVTCPPDRMVPCEATWTFDEPVVVSGCGAVVTIVSTTTNAGCGATYTARRTWSITDGITTTTCVQIIRTVDITPPTLVCPPDITVISATDAPHCPTTMTEFIFGGGQVSDACGTVRYRCEDGAFVGDACGGVLARKHVVFDECGNTNSCTQHILILGSPTTVSVAVTASGASTNPCVGGTLTFCAIPSGTGPFSFTWMLDMQSIPGETNSCLTVPNLSPLDVGRYSVQVVGMCAAITETMSLPGCSSPAPVMGDVVFMPAGVHVDFRGIADRSYVILCSPGLDKPWNVIGTATTGLDGKGEFIDPFATQDMCRVYRLIDPTSP